MLPHHPPTCVQDTHTNPAATTTRSVRAGCRPRPAPRRSDLAFAQPVLLLLPALVCYPRLSLSWAGSARAAPAHARARRLSLFVRMASEQPCPRSLPLPSTSAARPNSSASPAPHGLTRLFAPRLLPNHVGDRTPCCKRPDSIQTGLVRSGSHRQAHIRSGGGWRNVVAGVAVWPALPVLLLVRTPTCRALPTANWPWPASEAVRWALWLPLLARAAYHNTCARRAGPNTVALVCARACAGYDRRRNIDSPRQTGPPPSIPGKYWATQGATKFECRGAHDARSNHPARA